ncbi:hypothetical protein Ddye_009568 [Dipteronia dyeriana]|uniref:Phytocyanin domain-containing protein n=1 Tax=Dipteronia dyeriana TaxID=168575 RepID=A0AAE0CMG2_9ROSI|nr:hypothetical protein Ddye_009568 [Dipteronia dyeriana]
MAMATLLLFRFLFEIGCAANYTVGHDGGRSFGVSDWTKRKNCKVGDILKYKLTTSHNNLNVVVIIDEKGYKTCTVGGDVKKYYSGLRTQDMFKS